MHPDREPDPEYSSGDHEPYQHGEFAPPDAIPYSSTELHRVWACSAFLEPPAQDAVGRLLATIDDLYRETHRLRGLLKDAVDRTTEGMEKVRDQRDMALAAILDLRNHASSALDKMGVR